jgi:hypothetical protein
MTPTSARIDEDFTARFYRREPIVLELLLEDADGAAEDLANRRFFAALYQPSGEVFDRVEATIATGTNGRSYLSFAFHGDITDALYEQQLLRYALGEQLDSGQDVIVDGVLKILPAPTGTATTTAAIVDGIATRFVRRLEVAGRSRIVVSERGPAGLSAAQIAVAANDIADPSPAAFMDHLRATARAQAVIGVGDTLADLGEAVGEKFAEVDDVVGAAVDNAKAFVDGAQAQIDAKQPATANLKLISTGKQPVPVTALVTDPTNANIAAAFDAAKAYCVANSRGILELPKDLGYLTDRALVVDTPGLIIRGNGSRLRQTTWNTTPNSFSPAGFEVIADDVTIESFIIECAAARTANNVGLNGRAGISTHDCHRFTFRDVLVRNWNQGFYPAGTTGFGANGDAQFKQIGGRILDCSADSCDFGLLYGAQDQFLVDGWRSWNTTDILSFGPSKQQPAPHGIYATNAQGGYTGDGILGPIRDDDVDRAGKGGSGTVTIRNVFDYGNSHDSAYKFKNHRRLILENIRAMSSRILMQIEGCPDLIVDGYSLHDQYLTEADTNTAVVVSKAPRATLRNGRIAQRDGYNGGGFQLDNCEDALIDGIRITANQPSTGSEPIQISNGSHRATIRNASYVDRGNRNDEMFRFGDSSNCIVVDPEMIGTNRLGIHSGTSANNFAIVRSQLMRSGMAGGGLFWRANGTGTGNNTSLDAVVGESISNTLNAGYTNKMVAIGAASGGDVTLRTDSLAGEVTSMILRSTNLIRFCPGVNGLTGGEAFRITGVAVQANYLVANGNAAGSAPSLKTRGTDANVDLELDAAGTGHVRMLKPSERAYATAAELIANTRFPAVSFNACDCRVRDRDNRFATSNGVRWNWTGTTEAVS